MARINLLPWREERRRERQREFLKKLLVSAILGVVIVFAAVMVFDHKINYQQKRNELVQQEIRGLEVRIKKIDELERTRARLISRKQVIERLQASRSMTVELLDHLAKTIPVGVTLTTISQQGAALALSGSSQSNARVSAYLKELEVDELFLKPELVFVRTAPNPATAAEPYVFNIKVNIRAAKTAAEDDGFENEQNLGGSG